MRQWEIQKAIDKALKADTALMAAVTGVFDEVPQGTKYPYVVIGEDTALQWDTGSSVGSESTLTIHVWSRDAGRQECKEIMSLVYDVLHEAELSVDDAHAVFCYWEFGETLLDVDGKTRHGVMRFRTLTEDL